MKLLTLICIFLAGNAFAETTNRFRRTEDVIYGRKPGVALTLDVFQPAATNNGIGIAFMVSGGWFSSHEAINPAFYESFLNRGYTVFAVVHGAQPKYTIPEIEQDVKRALRFIRFSAKRFKVNPEKIGVVGASAGGHLSLILATKGTKGDPNAKDPVDRESSEVKCVGCFFPPTDFLNYGKPGDDAAGVGTLKDFKAAFGPRSENAEDRQKLAREISPIYFIHTNICPILILHGDADKLVPIYQAQKFLERCESVGGKTKLVVREGKQHGWAEMGKDEEIIADWFDEHLRAIKP